jgi:hypothetical protein
MIRALAVLLTLALAAGCFRDHPTTAAEIAQTDCVQCHTPEFQQSIQHMGQGSTACSACHSPTALPPWSFAHPQSPFPLDTGRHAQFKTQCHTCHDSARGSDFLQNLDCYGGGACHGDSHHHDPNRPGRCFECHPTGNAGD